MFSELPDDVQKDITQLLSNNQFSLAKAVYEQNVAEHFEKQALSLKLSIATSFTLNRVITTCNGQAVDVWYKSRMKIFFLYMYCLIVNG